jgi:Mlc titration factor MtfA (ptsG expression regulator)
MNQQQRKYFSNKVDERLAEFYGEVNNLVKERISDPYLDRGTRFLAYIKENKSTALSLDLVEVSLIGEMKKQLDGSRGYRSDSIPNIRLDKLVRGWTNVDNARCENYNKLCDTVKNARHRAKQMAEIIKDKAMLGNLDSELLIKSLDGFTITLESEYQELNLKLKQDKEHIVK